MSCDERVAAGIYARVYNCIKNMIWQVWACVLSINEVNFIVRYLTTA